MEKICIGDVVRFKGADKELQGQEFSVSFTKTLSNGDDEIELTDYPMYCFNASQFELVQKCPYADGDRITVKAVYWNLESKKFVIDEVIGAFSSKNGLIDFDERTLDCFHVPLIKLGRFYSSEENGNDFDVVFCLATDNDVKKAKQVWLNTINERISEIKQELSEMVASRDALASALK